MKYIYKILIIFFAVSLFSCTRSRVEDFFVPDFPLNEEYFEINYNEGFGKVLTYNFTLFKSNYNLSIDIEESLYSDAQNKSRQNPYDSGLGMRQDQYDVFVYDNDDEYVLNAIVDAINQSEEKNNYDLAQLLVAFVQSIPYDSNAKEPKFTIETLYKQTGDCDDKSILLAKLLSYAGYHTCLFIFEEGQHMAVGLKVDDSTLSYKNGYIFIESTGYHPIGDIPEGFSDNVDIRNEDPKIIEVDIANSDHAISGYDELTSFYTSVKDKFGEGYFNTTIEGRVLLENITKTDSLISVYDKEYSSYQKDLGSQIEDYNRRCSGTLQKDVYEQCLLERKSIEALENKVKIFQKNYQEKIDIHNGYINKLNKINSRNYIK